MESKYVESKIRRDYRYLTETLIKKGLTITTMESCTAGQIVSLITDTEGASAIMKGAFVTYCNDAKIMQGVPQEIIRKYSVYSKETAEAMAKACVNIYKANIGIGVTGTMGNQDLSNPEKSIPGQVYFALIIDEKEWSYYIELEPQKTRLEYKLAVAKEIYDELILKITEKD